MAATTLSDFTAVLASLFEDRITTQLNRSVPLAQLLPVSGGQGKNVQWVVRTGTDLGSAIADGADVSTFDSDTKTAAVLQWAVYHNAFAISGLAYHAARSAGNPAELAALFNEEMMETVQRLAARIGVDIYTGDPTASPTEYSGLVDATNGALKATGTYAGIDKGVVTQFAGNELLNGGVLRPISFQLLRDLRKEIYLASGEKPDLYVCSPAQHERIGLLYQTERRYMDEVRMNDGGRIKLDGGYNVLEWDGTAIIEDRNCPDSQLLALNSMHVNLKNLPSGPDSVNRASGTAALMGTPEEQFGEKRIPLTARIQPLAITGDSFKFALYVYTQLQVRRPNACGILGDLSV